MNKPIDFLSLIHFLNFFIFGLFYKKKYNYSKTRYYIKKYWPIPQKYWDERHTLNPVLDIFFNMLGYYLGNRI